MATPTAKACAAAALTAMALATPAGCTSLSAGATSQDSRDFTFSGRTLTIDARELNLTLVPGSAGKVSVRRRLAGSAVNGSSSWSLKNATLRLRTECSGLVLECESEHTVRVPKNVALKIDASGGAVRIEGLTGDVNAVLRNDGSLRVIGPKGTLRLRNHGGRIVVEDATSTDVRADTSADGTIRLGFAAAPDRVEAHASGSVSITLPAGPETYRVDAAGARGLPSDPDSDRVIIATAADGTVSLRKAG